MKTSNLLLVVSLVLYTVFNTTSLNAQQVIIENGVEYMTDKEDIDDGNSLSLDLVTSVKKAGKNTSKKKANVKRNVSASDVEKMLNRGGNNLRFRKKRNSEKCFEETVDECDKKDE